MSFFKLSFDNLYNVYQSTVKDSDLFEQVGMPEMVRRLINVLMESLTKRNQLFIKYLENSQENLFKKIEKLEGIIADQKV